MDTFWRFIVAVFRFPVDTLIRAFETGSAIGYVISFIAFLFIWGVTTAIAFFTIRGVYRKCVWYTTRERCQHCDDWTTYHSTGEFHTCLSQQPCCYGCDLKHQADSETVYVCPVDGTKMTKIINELGIIIDECGSCKGVWLTSAEIDAIIENAEDDARASGMLTGIVIGSAA